MNQQSGRRRALVSVAVASAIAWVLVVLMALDDRAASSAERIAFLVVAPSLGLLVALDIGDRVLPRQVSYASLAVFAVLASIDASGERLLTMMLGAIAMFAIAMVLSRGGRFLGRGDVHLCPLLGAMIGWFDPWQVVTAWMVAAVAAALWASIAMARARLAPDDVFAYGPFLLIGSAVALVMA